MKATILLADWAEAINGKLYIMGGGWSITGPGPAPAALALKIDVPWDETNRPHSIKMALVDDDGHPVVLPGHEKPLEITGNFEVGRPIGLPPGTSMDSVVALTLPPMALEPGQRYHWRLWIDDQSKEDWQATFLVRRGQAQPGRPLG